MTGCIDDIFMKIRHQTIAICCLPFFASLSHGQFSLQQFNETDSDIVTTTAPMGHYYELSGNIQDLSQFSGVGNSLAENPFGWLNWRGYSSVAVNAGVMEGLICSDSGYDPVRLISSRYAYLLDPNKFRYMEITFAKESNLGSGQIWFRVNGNSIATPGQTGSFNIQNVALADEKINSIILDMHELDSWVGASKITGLGLDIHVGHGETKNNTTDYLHSVRISDKISTNRKHSNNSPSRPPNIVFIFADDLGWADVGYRDPDGFFETPNIDRFASQNLEFTHAYSTGPLCTPTRAALFTGKYPSRLGLDRAIFYRPGEEFKPIEPRAATNSRPELPFTRLNLYENRNYLPLDQVTFAEILRNAGYATGLLGKWHLGSGPYSPQKRGDFVTIFGGHPGGNPGRYFYPYIISDVGEPGEYLTDRMAMEAEAFLEAYKNEPFCLIVSHFAVHTPIEAKEEDIAYFKAKAQKLGITHKSPVYAGMIKSLDDSVGRILKKLDELGLTDNTLVIFTSDNGGMLYEGWQMNPITSNMPLRGGKSMITEGGIRVPLIIRMPGDRVKTGIEPTPVSTVDFFPTFIEWAGKDLPRDIDIDGHSLLPLLRENGGQFPVDRDIIFHWPFYLGNQITRDHSRRGEYANRPNTTLRSGPYKYTFFYDGNRAELYNIEDDMGELHNLIEEKPDLAAEMEERIRRWANNTIPDYLPRKNLAYVEGYGLGIRNMTSVWVPFRSSIKLDDHHLIISTDEGEAFVESFKSAIIPDAPVEFIFRTRSESAIKGQLEWIDKSGGHAVLSQSFEFEGGNDYRETTLTVDLGPKRQFVNEFRLVFNKPSAFELEIDWLKVRSSDGQVVNNYDFGIIDTGNWKR
jgi:arylsulfatase A